MKPLSEIQKAILSFLQKQSKKNGYMPTYQEMAEAVGLASVATISYHLDQMAAKGYISRSFGKARAIKIKETK